METEESIDVTNSQEVTCYGSPVGSREHNHSEDTEVSDTSTCIYIHCQNGLSFSCFCLKTRPKLSSLRLGVRAEQIYMCL